MDKRRSEIMNDLLNRPTSEIMHDMFVINMLEMFMPFYILYRIIKGIILLPYRIIRGIIYIYQRISSYSEDMEE